MLRQNDRVAITVAMRVEDGKPRFVILGGCNNHFKKNRYSFNHLYQTFQSWIEDEGLIGVNMSLIGTIYSIKDNLVGVFTDIGFLFSVDSTCVVPMNDGRKVVNFITC